MVAGAGICKYVRRSISLRTSSHANFNSKLEMGQRLDAKGVSQEAAYLEASGADLSARSCTS